MRPVLWPALALAAISVALTAVLVGWFATAMLGFAWLEGLLLGAIVSSTDAAAVFAVLRSKSIALTGRLKPLIEMESAATTRGPSSSPWGSPNSWRIPARTWSTWCRCLCSK